MPKAKPTEWDLTPEEASELAATAYEAGVLEEMAARLAQRRLTFWAGLVERLHIPQEQGPNLKADWIKKKAWLKE